MAGRTAVGLDLGASGVRAAQLHVGRGGTVLERLGQVELPAGAVRDGEVLDPYAVADALQQLWVATRLSRRALVLGLSSPRVDVRRSEQPVPAQPAATSSAPQSRARRGAGGDALLDFLPLGPAPPGAPGGGQVAGLAVHAPRPLVDAALTALNLAGLHPVRVDVAAFAVLRSVGRTGEIGLGVPVEALVDVGAQLTTLVVHAAGRPRFVRVLGAGGRDVTDAISARLGIPGAEAEALKQQLPAVGSTSGLLAARVAAAAVGTLVHQLSACLDADRAEGGPAVHRITLTGGGSALAVLPERLRAATGVPVDRGGPLDALVFGRTRLSLEQLEQLAPRMAVPVGLALGGLT